MITSRNNTKIKKTIKLQKKHNRKVRGQFLIEGTKLFNEALDNGASIEEVFMTQDWQDQNFQDIKTDFSVELVSEAVMEKLSTLKNPEGVVAVVNIRDTQIDDENNCIYLDNIRDPGNLGTIIRTADAVGIGQVILSQNCVDPFNEKVIRSSMGSIFRVRIIVEDPAFLEILKEKTFKIIGAAVNGESVNIRNLDIPKRFILVFGSESHGLSPEVQAYCDELVTLPLHGNVESLNVAIAAGILMYAYTAN